MLDEVLIACRSSLASDASPALQAELGELSALDIAQMGYGDDLSVVGIEVLGVEVLACCIVDLCASLVAPLGFHLDEFVAYHLLAELGVVENLLEVGYEFLQFLILGAQFVLFESGELAQAHLDNCLGLNLVECIEISHITCFILIMQGQLFVGEAFHQFLDCFLWRFGCTDDVYHLVDIVAGNDQSLKDVCAFLCFLLVELRAPYHHVVAVFHEIVDELLEVEEHGASLDQRDVVDTEARLELGQFEEFVEDDLGVVLSFDIDDDSHALTVGLVVDVGNALNLLLVDEVSNLLDELSLVDVVWYLVNNNLVVCLCALYIDL